MDEELHLIKLLRQDNHVLKRKTRGECAGPCPWCGGRDRFIVFTETDRYWCRQCAKKGDAIQYLRDFRGMTYRDACDLLHIMPNQGPSQPFKYRHNLEMFKPRMTKEPPELWQARARDFLDRAVRNLRDDIGNEARRWLYDRGLNDHTLQQAELGWNPNDRHEDRENWGLDPVINDHDKPLKLWMPRGIIIPYSVNGHVVRLRIRRFDPINGSRYIVVSGSDMKPMLWERERKTFCIIESELDGLLIYQKANDLVSPIALGSAQARPDIHVDTALMQAEIALLSLDSDNAGAKEVWGWWNNKYPKVRRWPVPVGTDPTEAYQCGLDIRSWLLVGLSGGYR